MRGWGDLEGLDLTGVDQKVIDRFWAKVEQRGDCQVWVGLKGKARSKFPQFCVPLGDTKRIISAHQVAYALTHDGVLPPDVILRKSCSTVRCVKHWVAMTRSEAGRSISRASTPLPVDEIRVLRQAGAGCAELASTYNQFQHERIRDVMLNRTFRDPDYEPPVLSRRQEHPELFRMSDELVEEILEERASGTSIYKISRWAAVPYVTVWEAINGPSNTSRRRSIEEAPLDH